MIDADDAVAVVVEYNAESATSRILSYTPIDESDPNSVTLSYVSACDDSRVRSEFSKFTPTFHSENDSRCASHITPDSLFDYRHTRVFSS